MTLALDNAEAPAGRDARCLALLGLGTGASEDQIEAAHDAVIELLQAVPASLSSWAESQIELADEAYLVLSGAEPAVANPAPAARMALAFAGQPRRSAGGSAIDGEYGEAGEDEDAGDVDAEPARRATPRRGRAGQRDPGQARDDRARGRQGSKRAPRRAIGRAAVTYEEPSLLGRLYDLRKPILGAIALAAVVVVGVLGYKLGAPAVPGLNGTPAPAASSSGIDTARIGVLMQQISTNPKDVAALSELGNIYYAAGDYATAAIWLQKVIDIEPRNIAALLGAGAAAYNQADLATAEKDWRAVLAIDSKNVEAHYDLGFMYFSETPPDTAKAREEWNQVIALDPNSDIAKTVATHLQQLDKLASSAPAASGGASPAPSGSPAAAASPAPSTSPSGQPR